MTAPTWTEARVAVPPGWTERVAEVLGEQCGNAALIGTPSIGTDPPPAGLELVRVYLPAADDGSAKRRSLERALAELGRAVGSRELERAELSFRVLPPEDWARSWRKVWRPFRVGRLEVVAPWTPAPARAGTVRLVMEPGAVFGSGRHATTRTSLRVLAERVRGGERVLDCGTGSGILSVAAALLGAAEACGFDVDPNAEPAADRLARDNGVADRCRFRTGGFDELERGPFDVVCANIYADVLQRHAPALAERVAQDGFLLASGCALARREPTRDAFVAAGLTRVTEHRRGRWVTFVAARAS